jgi:hypothetical protein
MLKMSAVSSHAGTAGDKTFIPVYVYMTGAVCRDFLRNILPELFQDVNMQTKDHLWFMHDQALHYIVFLQFGHS